MDEPPDQSRHSKVARALGLPLKDFTWTAQRPAQEISPIYLLPFAERFCRWRIDLRSAAEPERRCNFLPGRGYLLAWTPEPHRCGLSWL